MNKVALTLKKYKNGDLSLQRQEIGVDRRIKRMGADGWQFFVQDNKKPEEEGRIQSKVRR